LGTPSQDDIISMNKKFKNFNFPIITKCNLFEFIEHKRNKFNKIQTNVISEKIDNNTIDLLSNFLQYNPKKRITPLEALYHPFFDDLKNKNIKLPNGLNIINNLYEFTKEELN